MAAGAAFAAGDRVLVKRNDDRCDVRNGDRGVVDHVDLASGTLHVRFDDRDDGPRRRVPRPADPRRSPSARARLRHHRVRRPGHDVSSRARPRARRRVPRVDLHDDDARVGGQPALRRRRAPARARPQEFAPTSRRRTAACSSPRRCNRRAPTTWRSSDSCRRETAIARSAANSDLSPGAGRHGRTAPHRSLDGLRAPSQRRPRDVELRWMKRHEVRGRHVAVVAIRLPCRVALAPPPAALVDSRSDRKPSGSSMSGPSSSSRQARPTIAGNASTGLRPRHSIIRKGSTARKVRRQKVALQWRAARPSAALRGSSSASQRRACPHGTADSARAARGGSDPPAPAPIPNPSSRRGARRPRRR